LVAGARNDNIVETVYDSAGDTKPCEMTNAVTFCSVITSKRSLCFTN